MYAQKSRDEVLLISKYCQLYLVYKRKVFNKYIVDFKQRSEISKSFFADKSALLLQLILLTEKSLANCHFQNNQEPSSNKALGNDQISIPSGDWICQRLEMNFKTCIRNERFPLRRKKANVVPIHKKDDEQTIENYRLISFLPICGKIFERLLYDSLDSFPSINFFQLIMKS